MRFWVETYYDYQKQRIQTGNRIGSHVIRKLEPDTWQEKKEKDDKSYGKQYNMTEVRKKYQESKDQFSVDEQAELDTMFHFMEEAKKLEKFLDSEIKDGVKEYPIYSDYLVNIKGVGHVLSAGLIAWIQDVEKYATVSKLWAYAGLHVVDGEAARRKQGQQSNWNTRLKTHCWKLGDSFIKSKGPYRELYDKYRLYEEERFPDLTKLHRFNRAKRKTVKVFLSHLWVRWRELEGLPVSKPYCEAYRGHRGVPAPC